MKLADDTEADELKVKIPISEETEAGETQGDRCRLGGNTVGEEYRSANSSPKDLSSLLAGPGDERGQGTER